MNIFNIDSSLVLLGEPGAGKSELLRFASQKLGATVCDASTSKFNVAKDNKILIFNDF